LLKAAAKGELPLQEAAEKVGAEIASRAAVEANPEGLAYVKQALADAKKTAILSLAAVARAYGEKASEEQEVMGLVAEMLMEVYALESALLRTEKLMASRGEERSRTPVDITRAYASDAADRVASSARQLVAALEGSGEAEHLASAVMKLAPQRPINTIAARRRIADAVIEAGRYPW
jgi:hypothetical protein